MCCSASAVLLARLAAALPGAVGLLLLLLAGLLAATLLLLAGLGLLAGVLVGILVLTHSVSFQRWSFDAPRPYAKTTRERPFGSVSPVPPRSGNPAQTRRLPSARETMTTTERRIMGRYLLLWLLGIPLPILLLIWVFGGLH